MIMEVHEWKHLYEWKNQGERAIRVYETKIDSKIKGESKIYMTREQMRAEKT